MSSKERLEFLYQFKDVTIADLEAKVKNHDWHGVWDSAIQMDLIESEIKGLTNVHSQ